MQPMEIQFSWKLYSPPAKCKETEFLSQFVSAAQLRLSDLTANGRGRLRSLEQRWANTTPTSRPPDLEENPSLRIREKPGFARFSTLPFFIHPKSSPKKSKLYVYIPGTLDDRFYMDVWLNNKCLCKGLEPEPSN